MNGRAWTASDDRSLRKLHPRHLNQEVARRLRRSVGAIVVRAYLLGLHKDPAWLLQQGRKRATRPALVAHRFAPGHVPANKGLRRPGWSPGRMAETQFKKGNVSKRWDPDTYFVGALRLNSYGVVDMKIKEGLRAWRAFHMILWEDAHGPLPKGHCLRFKDGDSLNIELDNIELITRAENMRRNTIHNLPKPLVNTIMALGALKRRIREKQDRRPA